jgi:hypothetical protein
MDISESGIGSVLSGAIRQWAVSFPIIAVWIVGLLVAFGRWRRSPKVSMLVILSSGLGLLMTLVMPIVQQIAITTLNRSNPGSISTILTAVGFVWTCLAAVTSGLLIFAAFADRPEVGS